MAGLPQQEQDQEQTRLTLTEMGPVGDTLACHEGEVVNVFGGIPGEDVLARIIRYRGRRRSHTSALVMEVLKPSPHRVAPPCPYFGPCTGCQWQHIEYDHQLRLKRQAVERELRRHPELEGVGVSPAIAAPDQLGYRNHARLTVRNRGSLGFVNRITRRFVSIDRCLLMAPWINDALAQLEGKCGETTQLSIRYGSNTGDWLVQPTLQDPDVPLPSGQAYFREEVLGRPFRISSPSFFQVNTAQTERLVELVRDRLALNGSEVLVDAYAGVGTFSVLFAPLVRKIVAVEESAAAVKDAAVNTLGIGNLEFVQAKTEEVLGTLDPAPDAVVVDPPRAGCHPAVLEALARRPAGKVVYVSCEPETLARDLAVLVRSGFHVRAVEPIDMFPQTHHVECVATLSAGG